MKPSTQFRRFRRKIGVTQREFARALGITQRTIVSIELGQHRPNYKTMAAFDALVAKHDTQFKPSVEGDW